MSFAAIRHYLRYCGDATSVIRVNWL